METTVRTIYSSHLANMLFLKKPFQLIPGSTLNDKFQIFHNDQALPDGEYPSLRILTLGNGSAKYERLSTGEYVPIPIPHTSRQAALYRHMPFVVRPQTGDLTDGERKRYRLRQLIEAPNGERFIAYYGRLLEGIDEDDKIVPTALVRKVEGRVVTSSEFEVTEEDINPVSDSVILSNVDLNNPDGLYLSSSAKLEEVLTEQDIDEIKSACDILFGSDRLAIITEMAVCTGYDKDLLSTDGVNYTESVCTQVSTFFSQYLSLPNMNTETPIVMDVGSSESLLAEV